MGIRTRTLAGFLFILLMCALLCQAAVASDRRVALVIGNSAYVHTSRLDNPRNDAADFAAILDRLGFDVIKGHDLDKAAMDRSIRNFAESLADSQMGLFFYAGHGLQVSGQNYLVLIDAKLTAAAALDFEMVRLDLVQRSMERVANTNIIILDACRDNPLARNLARALGSRSSAIGRGLAAMESGEGTLISFSTQPGNVALDGSGRNSPFTAALLNHITAPGEDLPSILINVRNDVMAATDRRQVPWEHSALTAKVYFTPPKPVGPTVEQQMELAFWSSVKDSTNPTVLATYLERYPKGEFAPIARALIEHYEQQLKATLAVREEEHKREEEAKKAAEVKRLEDERKAREATLSEESLRAKHRTRVKPSASMTSNARNGRRAARSCAKPLKRCAFCATRPRQPRNSGWRQLGLRRRRPKRRSRPSPKSGTRMLRRARRRSLPCRRSHLISSKVSGGWIERALTARIRETGTSRSRSRME